MKLAYNNWAYTSFFVWTPSYTLEDTIKRLAAIGYDGIEIGAGAPHAWPAHLTKKRRGDIKKLLEKHEIVVSSMLPAPSGGPGNNPVSPLIEERRWTVQHYKEIITLCRDWDCHTLIYLPGWRVFGTTRRQAWKWSQEALKQIADFAAKNDVTMVIEPTPHDTNLCESSYDAIELMEDVNHPNVKLLFDMYHQQISEGNLINHIRQHYAQIGYMQVGDVPGRKEPGTGEINYQNVFKSIHALGYKGILGMEHGWTKPGIDGMVEGFAQYRKADSWT